MSTIKADTVTASTTDGNLTLSGNGTGTTADMTAWPDVWPTKPS